MHKSHGVQTVRRVGSVGAALAAMWMVSAMPAQAAPMTWEMDGTITSSTGFYAPFMPTNTAITLTLFGDAAQTPSNPCPPAANAAVYTILGAQLTVGSLTWTRGPISYIERHDEAGFCGAVGAALDFNSFDWTFSGTPPNPGLMFLNRVYAELSPVDE